MEAETRKVSNRTDHSAVPFCTESMCIISQNCHPANGGLKFAFRAEKILLSRDDIENSVIIAGNSGKINRNNCLGVFGDRIFKGIVVHLKTIFLRINQNDFGTNVVDHRCRSGIGIRRRDDLISGAYAQQAQSHLGTCSLRIQTNAFFYTKPLRNVFFQLFCPWTGSDPTGAKSRDHFFYFQFANIRRTKGNVSVF